MLLYLYPVSINVKSMSRQGILTIFVILIMLGTYSINLLDIEKLENEKERKNQFGGGGSLEEQCSSITFEEMFIYDKAIFDIRINEDWQTAEVEAVAWINWTNADDIREDFDEYLDGYLPSGGDGWISTDEIAPVLLIAADCLEYTITRMGFRDGSPHRGGVGVDWKNTSWQNDGMQIGHYNGIPERHIDRRDCQGFSQDGCYEIPVRPNENRDCDIEIENSPSVDECRIMLWLNATMEIPGITNSNNFTISFNSSNISNAQLDFTFPPTENLRLDIWEECEGRFVGPENENPRTYSTPLRGSCIGDGLTNYTLYENNDTSLTYSIFPNMNREQWPGGEDIFADFTTSPIPIDIAPEWTQAAYPNNSWIPMYGFGERKFAEWVDISSWFIDDSAVSELDILCFSNNLPLNQSIDKSLWIDIKNTEEITEISCKAEDATGQQTENRTWLVGSPVTLSTTRNILDGPHPFKLEFSNTWEKQIQVRVKLTQGGLIDSAQEFIIHGDNNLTNPLTSFRNIEINEIGMIPGKVSVWVEITSDNNSIEKILDFDIEKLGSPPAIENLNFELEDRRLKLNGFYSEPDGEIVNFKLLKSDEELDIKINDYGNSWATEWIEIGEDSGLTTFTISGCDNSGMCTKKDIVVNLTNVNVENVGGEIVEDNRIPASGIITVLCSMLIAIILRKED